MKKIIETVLTDGVSNATYLSHRNIYVQCDFTPLNCGIKSPKYLKSFFENPFQELFYLLPMDSESERRTLLSLVIIPQMSWLAILKYKTI